VVKSQFFRHTLLALFAGSALLAPLAAHAAAPAMLIDKPGTYALANDITVASGDAIMITASGVILDLAGHNVSVSTPGQGRGIVVLGAKGVRVSNGRVSPFAIDVHLDGSENVTVEGLQILGANLAALGAAGNPADPRASGSPGFAEVGVLLTNTRGAVVRNSTITSVNAGIFNRGAGSTGSLFQGNTITGGPNGANDILAVCFNGLPTEDGNGPTACVIQGNHVGHYNLGLLWQGLGTTGNISRDNTVAVWGSGYLFPDTAHMADNMKGTTMANDTVVMLPAP
jgi:parallel beta helix pectate lyase-like protein